MIQRNPAIARLAASYLFVEIAKRKEEYLKKHPGDRLISLGIGDTTEPIPEVISEGFIRKAQELSTLKGYTGYGDSAGVMELRKAIAEKIYLGRVEADEVFVSDGSKSDLARMQMLFGSETKIALQDPSYPAYISGSVIAGKSGSFDQANGRYEGIKYLTCDPTNGFFPDLEEAKGSDLLYFCSPNNPTGMVPTRRQMEELVAFAKRERMIIVFDSAYMGFIRGKELVRSIFEIEGAKEVALETGSFSKMGGFTGVRLGWTVVPKALKFAGGESVRDDWTKVISACFNAASNIAQAGGVALLSDEGMAEVERLTDFYWENGQILKRAVESSGYKCYGGDHAPYLWVWMNGEGSWEAFDRLLKRAQIVTTPGVGFGPAGEGFLRFSAFGHRADIEEAARRLKSVLARQL
jgi:LL-diaminopimelate aminotransferase